MRYRENIVREIERLETALKQLHTHINRGGTQKEANGTLEKSEAILAEVKSYVERETRTFDEYK
jgi:hypothetical protein